MALYGVMKGMLYLLLVIIGIPGNLTVLAAFSMLAMIGNKLLLTEVVICSIALVSMVLSLTRGLPVTMYVLFELKDIYTDIGCKFIVYLARVSRGLAIGQTCVLVCIQCIFVAPNNTFLSSLKHNLAGYVIKGCALVLLSNIMLEISSLTYTVSKLNSTFQEYTFNFGYCIIVVPDYVSYLAVPFSFLIRDLILVILMSISSGYILLILFKHKKQVSRIKRKKGEQKMATEMRAAKVVVTLVTLYIFFFGFENTIFLYQIIASTHIHPIISDVRHFFSVCYASVFPAVIILSNSRIKSVLKCYLISKKRILVNALQHNTVQ
ncbi:olfactory receptor class A-like protein 1 [Protopterus annectens]|uniref:olfactory receptor class A-like protein 1 n=1 Tax=Protopterus annectens TaxID=7888 RepID=UPI001CF94CD4|nr:olfactory receptor class A-like protein 1 [Protopterus annectens]